MRAVMKVFGGVFVLGRIAASHVAANHTHTQVDPGVAGFHAIFADMLVGRPNLDLLQMLALR
jgi:hypothetical protein